MNKLLKALLKNWVLKNFPKETQTEVITIKKVERIKTIFVKKGKIREWRSYDENHNRIDLVK